MCNLSNAQPQSLMDNIRIFVLLLVRFRIVCKHLLFSLSRWNGWKENFVLPYLVFLSLWKILLVFSPSQLKQSSSLAITILFLRLFLGCVSINDENRHNSLLSYLHLQYEHMFVNFNQLTRELLEWVNEPSHKVSHQREWRERMSVASDQVALYKRDCHMLKQAL